MLLSRISLHRVRYAAKNCVQQRFPTFNYSRLFIRDSGHGWLEQRHRFAFGRDA